MKANAKVDQLVTAARDLKAGEPILETDVQSRTITTITCYNPKCGVEITWCQEDVAKDNDAAPEAFFRILTLQRSYMDPADQQAGDTGKYVFCSAYCLIKWLQHAYEPSCSPAESRRRAEAAAKELAAAKPMLDQLAASPEVAAALAAQGLKFNPEAIPESGIDSSCSDVPDGPLCESGVTTPTVEVPPLEPFVGVPGVIEPDGPEEDLDTNSPQWN
jgi:hypothetical protein